MASKEEILNLLLSLVDDKYDKQVGSPIYDVLYPVAEKLALIDTEIETAKSKMDIANLSGDELAQRVYERTGIERVASVKAEGSVTLTGTGTIFIGDLFETQNGIQFQATETKSITTSGTVAIEAVIGGSEGNVPANTIKLFPVTLSGFTAVTNPSPTTDGFNAESDADLLVKYYERLRTPSTSGNKAAYKSWAKSVPGVGDVKVIPSWNGANTVKLIVIDDDKKPASSAIIDAVKVYIDASSTGTGDGLAPIGNVLTVVAATGTNINIAATIEVETGYTLQQAKDNITKAITDYLKEIAFVKDNVSFAKIGSAILDADGVQDYSSLTVNGGTSNVIIADSNVPIVGMVNITT